MSKNFKTTGKKILFRLIYIKEDGILVTHRNTGKKSSKKFQEKIDSGIFDEL